MSEQTHTVVTVSISTDEEGGNEPPLASSSHLVIFSTIIAAGNTGQQCLIVSRVGVVLIDVGHSIHLTQ